MKGWKCDRDPMFLMAAATYPICTVQPGHDCLCAWGMISGCGEGPDGNIVLLGTALKIATTSNPPSLHCSTTPPTARWVICQFEYNLSNCNPPKVAWKHSLSPRERERENEQLHCQLTLREERRNSELTRKRGKVFFSAAISAHRRSTPLPTLRILEFFCNFVRTFDFTPIQDSVVSTQGSSALNYVWNNVTLSQLITNIFFSSFGCFGLEHLSKILRVAIAAAFLSACLWMLPLQMISEQSGSSFHSGSFWGLDSAFFVLSKNAKDGARLCAMLMQKMVGPFARCISEWRWDNLRVGSQTDPNDSLFWCWTWVRIICPRNHCLPEFLKKNLSGEWKKELPDSACSKIISEVSSEEAKLVYQVPVGTMGHNPRTTVLPLNTTLHGQLC